MKKIIFLLFLVNNLIQCRTFSKSDSLFSENDSIKTRSKWQIGFRLDYNCMIETVLLNYESQPEYVNRFHIYRDYIISPFGLYFPLRYNYSPNFNLEIRTGILASGDQLSSINLCLSGYYFLFNTDLFITTGFEISKRSKIMEFSQQPHYIPNQNALRFLYRKKIYSSLIFGIGFRLGKSTSADFSILKPLNEKYGCYIINEETGRFKLPNGKYDLELHWMLKLGINFYF